MEKLAPAVLLEDFSFKYSTSPGTIAAGPVDWQVEEGAFCLLVGATGSGKTMLLKQLKPQISPHGERSGTILVFGEDPKSWTLGQSARMVGYVSQNPDEQIVCSTVLNELAFGLENMGMPQDSMRRRIAEVSHFFGIEPFLHQQTDQLSGGQKQILCLASIMALQPRMLLLDEPTAQLDPISQQSFLHALFRVNRQLGITVVVATHQPEAMEDYATGKLLLESPASTALRNASVAEMARCLASDRGHGGKGVAISVEDAHVSYPQGDRLVLRGCDMDVAEGSIHAIMGGNGCGKTTLLCTVAGILKARRGKVRNNLKDCQALLPQDPRALFVRDSVWEELTEWSGDESATHWMEIAGLQGLAKHHPYDLSGGQQQLLALAKLLATSPKLLLLDEPTKGLDAGSKLDVARLLLEARSQGATVLVASHDLSFVKAVADSASLMFDGAIACTETPEAFFRKNIFYRPPDDEFSKLRKLSAELAGTECPNEADGVFR